jgi:hypothetical protein
MFARVKALLNKFQFGGIVRGGVANRDSVPALLTPGEIVLNQKEAREIQRQREPAPAPQVNLTISPQIQNPEEMTDAQIKRWMIRLTPQFEELFTDGVFLRGAART